MKFGMGVVPFLRLPQNRNFVYPMSVITKLWMRKFVR
jgi:hypothetical protein